MPVTAARPRPAVDDDLVALRRAPPGDEPLVQTFDGRQLRVEFREDVVVDLVRGAAAGRRIEPQLRDLEGERLGLGERESLLASDMERIDAHTVERGLSRAMGRTDAEPPTLILAVSYLTAASQRARTRLLSRSSDEMAALRHSAIWLLTDLPEQAPPGRVGEVASMIKPFGRAVFGKTRLSAPGLKTLRGCGLSGLLIEPTQALTTAVDGALWLLQAGKMAEKAAPALVALDLPTPELYDMAREAGFTHAVLA